MATFNSQDAIRNWVNLTAEPGQADWFNTQDFANPSPTSLGQIAFGPAATRDSGIGSMALNSTLRDLAGNQAGYNRVATPSPYNPNGSWQTQSQNAGEYMDVLNSMTGLLGPSGGAITPGTLSPSSTNLWVPKEQYGRLPNLIPVEEPKSPSGFVGFRDFLESVGVMGGNFLLPGSSLLTSNLVSQGAQENLADPLFGAANLMAGGAGGLAKNISNYGKLANLFPGGSSLTEGINNLTSGISDAAKNIFGGTNALAEAGSLGETASELPSNAFYGPDGEILYDAATNTSGGLGSTMNSADWFNSPVGIAANSTNAAREGMTAGAGGLSQLFSNPTLTQAGQLIGGLYGASQNRDIADQLQQQGEAMDPFRSQRPQYQNLLSQSYSDPFSAPEFSKLAALYTQQIMRKMAGKGLRGNPMQIYAGLQDQMTGHLDKYRESLMAPSGANLGAGAGANLFGEAANRRSNSNLDLMYGLSTIFQPGGVLSSLGSLFG